MKRLREPGVGIEHWGPPQFDPERVGSLPGLDVVVVKDLEMVGDEADRGDQDCTMALRGQRFDRVDQIGTEPRLPGLTLALVGEPPLLDASSMRHQLRSAQQLILVGITLIKDARRQTVRRENDDDVLGVRELPPSPPHILGDRVEVAVQVVPALDEVQLDR